MEDEIDLGQILMVLWRKKFLILFISIVSVILGVYTAAKEPKIYHANSLIMARSKLQEFLISGNILNRVVERLSKLPVAKTVYKDRAFSAGDIKGMLNIKKTDQDLLRLEVKSINPELSMELANIWAESCISVAKELFFKARDESIYAFFHGQMKKAEVELSREEKKLTGFDTRNQIEINDFKLESMKDKLILMLEEFIDERTEDLETRIGNLQKEVIVLEKELTTLAVERNKIVRDLNVIKNRYSALSNQVVKSEIAFGIGFGDIKLVSRSIYPVHPAGSRKRKTVFIAVAMGLAIGFLCAFLVDFVEKQKTNV